MGAGGGRGSSDRPKSARQASSGLWERVASGAVVMTVLVAAAGMFASVASADSRPSTTGHSGKSGVSPNGEDHWVNYEGSLDLPKGTHFTSSFLTGSDDSNCVRTPWDTGFYTVSGDIFHKCAYEKSFGTFKVRIETPTQQTEWTVVRLQQTSSPGLAMKVQGYCTNAGNLNCTGGSGQGDPNVNVPIKFGPLQTGPTGYQFCVGEDDQCTLPATGSSSGARQVAYGAAGKYNYKSITGRSVACNNPTFGDPIYGAKKACFTKVG
jgi:hypothetical protein